MDLHRFDLNLLLAFDALMRELSVTKAAQRLFVSQSAMSHSLGRLRKHLDDPLLVAVKGGMKATARAAELEPLVRAILLGINHALSTPQQFDPASSRHRFVLGSTDYAEYVFLPPLMQRLAGLAPNVDIELKHFDANKISQHLAEGDLDVALRLFSPEPMSGIYTEQVMVETPSVLLRVDHPAVKGGELSLEQYVSLPHVVIDSLELTAEIESILARHGLARQVKLRTPNFLSAPIILAETDMLATLPLNIANRFIHGGRLKVVPLPMELAHVPINLCWHSVLHNDPAQQWFRQQLLEVGRELRIDTAG